MQLETKEVDVEKQIRFFGSFLFQGCVFMLPKQVLSLRKEPVQKESNAFPDRLSGKSEDNLAADRGDIELLACF